MTDVTPPSNFSVDAGLMENLKVNLTEKVKWQFSEVYILYNEVACPWNESFSETSSGFEYTVCCSTWTQCETI